MEMTYNHKLFKFIDKEVSEIYKKYSNIPAEEVSLVERFIEKIEEGQIDFEPYLDYNTTKSFKCNIDRNKDILVEFVT